MVTENSLHRRHGKIVQTKKLGIGKRIARGLPGLLVRCQAPPLPSIARQIEDRIIDCWVAFEALFLPEESGEVSYRPATRIARLYRPQEILRRSLLLCTDPLLSRAPDGLEAALPA